MSTIELLMKEDTYKLIGICMEVHRRAWHGFLEIVYKDAIEFELNQRSILYEREKEYKVHFKSVVLPHKFHADFVVVDKIILEVKAAEGGLGDDYVSQTINYLKTSGCKVGLLVNFGRASLEYKRLVF